MPPPPPPPAPPAPPPPPAAARAPAADNDAPTANSALLKSIQKGARLKKVDTNDRSSPLVDVPKAAGGGPAANAPVRPPGSGRSPPLPRAGATADTSASAAPQLGGLFAGGMPKLKPTGNRPGGSSAPPPPAAPSFGAPPPPSRSNGSDAGPPSFANRSQPQPPAPRQLGPSAALPTPPRSGPITSPSSGPPPPPPGRSALAPPAPPARTSPPAQRTSPPPPPSRFGSSAQAPPSIPARQPPPPPPPVAHRTSISQNQHSLQPPPPPPPSRSNITAPGFNQKHAGGPEIDSGPARASTIAFANTLAPKPHGTELSRRPSDTSSATFMASAGGGSHTLTETDGRWTFRTDLPLPRQFPSGDPASAANAANIGGSASPALRTSRAPPPPPPSRPSVSKRPPPPPPPR